MCPLISPVLLKDLWSKLEQAWENWGFLKSTETSSTENLSGLQYFVQTGDWRAPGEAPCRIFHSANEEKDLNYHSVRF